MNVTGYPDQELRPAVVRHCAPGNCGNPLAPGPPSPPAKPFCPGRPPRNPRGTPRSPLTSGQRPPATAEPADADVQVVGRPAGVRVAVEHGRRLLAGIRFEAWAPAVNDLGVRQDHLPHEPRARNGHPLTPEAKAVGVPRALRWIELTDVSSCNETTTDHDRRRP